MSFRKKMHGSKNRRNFKRGTKHHRKNNVRIMRGGYRM